MDGSTVSLTEHVGKTEKWLWYDNEGMQFTHCDGKNPAPQPPLLAPDVCIKFCKVILQVGLEVIYTQLSDVKSVWATAAAT